MVQFNATPLFGESASESASESSSSLSAGRVQNNTADAALAQQVSARINQAVDQFILSGQEG